MTTTSEKTRHDTMRAIERKHLGRCLDQIWTNGRRVLIEQMDLVDHRSSVIVVKRFERAVPKDGRGDWPELAGVQVYIPIDEHDHTWDELDRELAKHREKMQSHK